MEINAILFVVNTAIGFWLVHIIRKQDYYRPEPLGKMILATVIGGILSIIIAIGVISGLKSIGLYTEINFTNLFLFTGPIEETAKLLGFILVIKICKIKFDEPVDSIIYMSCVALGFSLIENFTYALDAPILLGLRSATSTPAHIIFSITMALVFANTTDKHKYIYSLVKAILVASLFHSIYDALVLSHALKNVHLISVFLILMFLGKRVFSYTLLNSPHRKDLLSSLGGAKPTVTKHCVGCKTEAPHQAYVLNEMSVEECQACSNVVLPEKKAIQFLNYFLPHFFVMIGRNKPQAAELNGFFIQCFDSKYKPHRKLNLQKSGPQIEELAEKLRNSFEKSIMFRFIFSGRPTLANSRQFLVQEYNETVSNEDVINTFKIVTISIALIAGLFGSILLLIKLLS